MGARSKPRRWGKRLALTLLLLVGALVVLAFTYTWWLPMAARPIAKRYGVSFGTFERLKDGRFSLTELTRTNRHFDVEIAKVEGYLPHVWRSKLSETNAATAFIEVNGWRVVVHDQEKKDRKSARKERPERSVYEEWKRVERYLGEVREYV